MIGQSPPIETLAGRPRQTPVAIFQDVESLDRIATGIIDTGGFGYDLANTEFQAYLKARGVLFSAGRPGSVWWDWCAAPNGRTFAAFCEQEEFRFAQEYPPDSGQRHEFTRHEQEFHWTRLKRTWARLADGWELFHRQAASQPVEATKAERAQRLLDEAKSYGVEFERHGETVDKTGGDFPKGRWKAWKSEFNEVWREFIRLLPDMDSLMKQPEGFVEVSPGNFAHQDDLPSVRAMMAMSGIDPPKEPEAETKSQAAPKRKSKLKLNPAEMAGQLSLF